MKSIIFPLLVIFSIFLLAACGSSSSNPPPQPPIDTGNNISFSNPQEVTISGYSGDAQEPHISRDDNTLFFNNLNADTLPDGSENDTNLHYAIRVNDVTFQYMGEVAGANMDSLPGVNELEGVASLDKNHRFYFVNTAEYLEPTSPNYLRSLFVGDYANGSLTNISSLPNLKSDRPAGQAPILGELNFDAEIHYDGLKLYYVEGIFSGNPFPDEANIAIANNSTGSFIAAPNSETLFNQVNTSNLEYAPSISSDQLELYFTRLIGSASSGFDFGIYVATRESLSEAWGNIKRLTVADGEFSEAPSISFDGQLLYYHQKPADVFKIYVVQRD